MPPTRRTNSVLALIGALVLGGVALVTTVRVVRARETGAPRTAAVAPAPDPIADLIGRDTSDPKTKRDLPQSRNYRPEAAWLIRKAFDHAGQAMRAGEPWKATAILEDEGLAGKTGVIVERYPGMRVDATRPLPKSDWDALAASSFDVSYAIGSVGHRGIVLGTAQLPNALDAVFPDVETKKRFFTVRALSLIEPWTHVLQDVLGAHPASERTIRYVRETGNRAHWASVDVIAVYADMDVPVPDSVVSDPRFPAWRAFWEWHQKRRAEQ